MKVIKRILAVIISLVLVVLLIYNIYKFICTNILKKEMATINGYAILEVVSGSMEPTLKVGDLIIIDTKYKNYKKNDIVTYYGSEGEFVTHRIQSIKKKTMITKGDNNNTQDKPVNTDKLVGKYVLKINKGQKIISALKHPIIIILILVNGVLFSIFVSIDNKGNIILDDKEKEYIEFKEYMNKKNK